MTQKVVITGAAGLVGQNLIPRLAAAGFTSITAIDKHPVNTRILRRQHPGVRVLEQDLASDDRAWQAELAGCDALVVGHAQIGGLVPAEYTRNNVEATERLMEAALRHRVPYLVNISSSVVNSLACDNYTETKKAQEALVAATGIPQVILRPTLMFGWLARFMQRAPIFPIPRKALLPLHLQNRRRHLSTPPRARHRGQTPLARDLDGPLYRR